MKDDWFQQLDIINRIELDSNKTECKCLYEFIDNYLEFLKIYSFLINQNSIKEIMKEDEWSSSDFIKKKSKFLIKDVKNIFNLTLKDNKYISNSDKVIAQRIQLKQTDCYSEKLTIRSDALEEYLKIKKLKIVTCIISRRYSERTLEEYGLKESMINSSSDLKNYTRSYTPLYLVNKPRMNSMSTILGKYTTNF